MVVVEVLVVVEEASGVEVLGAVEVDDGARLVSSDTRGWVVDEAGVGFEGSNARASHPATVRAKTSARASRVMGLREGMSVRIPLCDCRQNRLCRHARDRAWLRVGDTGYQ